MSLHENPTTQVPDTLEGYTDREIELARKIQEKAAYEARIAAEAKRKRFFKIAGASLAGVTAVGSAGAVFFSTRGDSKPAPSKTVATAPATETAPVPTPSETAGSSPTDIPTSIQPTETAPKGEQLNAALDAMQPAEFFTYPEDARVGYALSKYRILNDRGSLYDFTDQVLGPTTILSDLNPYNKPLDEFANPEDIVLQNKFAEQIAKAWKEDISTAGGAPIDKTTAEKLISGVVADPKSAEYKSFVDTIENTTNVGRIADDDLNRISYGKSSTKKTTNSDGTVTTVMEIPYSVNGQNITKYFKFSPQDELGAGKGLWLQVSADK